LLRRVLMTILAERGRDLKPFADGPIVRAVDLELLRTEFYRQHPAIGTDQQKAEARRKSFGRALKDAQATDLISCREVEAGQFVWLVAGGEGSR
jgi:hypothetical protein